MTGVRFSGLVKLNSNGEVISKSSKMIIKIYDSYSTDGSLDNAGQVVQPIVIPIDGSLNGQSVIGVINRNVGVTNTIVFKSAQYGEVRLVGQFKSNGYFSGQISYQNYINVITNEPASSGVLGQFYIASCAFIQ